MLLSGDPAAPGLLRRYLRLLWDREPALVPIPPEEKPVPFISPLGIHLPQQPPDSADRHWHLAAAAHAAAHLVHGRDTLPWASRTAITRALIGTLEDSRAELLAARGLPGLGRLWRSLHRATPELGPGFAPLLARLARALIDPDYCDPHPWIAKGRALFAAAGSADATAAELNRAASLLGNDIGQMRLQFNDRERVMDPDYRDDNRWLWQAESTQELTIESPAEDGSEIAEARPLAGGVEPEAERPERSTARLHSEWDRLIRRHRAAWCTVREVRSPTTTSAPAATPDAALVATVTRVLRERPAHRRELRPREADGETQDLAALVDLRLQQRLRHPVDDRVCRRSIRRRAPLSLLVLIDASASTAGPALDGTRTVLELARQAADALATAAPGAGCTCALHAFRSAGRGDVRYERILDNGDPWDAAGRRRLQSLVGGHSTRLGAALRHATAVVREAPGPDRLIVVLTDGEPHDTDVHDPRYLPEDARHAVQEAQRVGVRIAGLGLAGGPDLRRILGFARWADLRGVGDLPRALRTVL